jgi:biopolymer transport protein ExbB
MIGIPAHLAHHFLTGRVRAILRDMEWAGNEIMRYLLIEYRRPGVETLEAKP